MSAFAERLRASADAIEAEARERASSLRAMAAELDSGADTLVPLARAAADVGVSARVLRDAARRGALVIEGPRSARVVRRSELDRWLRDTAPRARPLTRAYGPNADRAAFERTALRLAAGGSP